MKNDASASFFLTKQKYSFSNPGIEFGNMRLLRIDQLEFR